MQRKLVPADQYGQTMDGQRMDRRWTAEEPADESGNRNAARSEASKWGLRR